MARSIPTEQELAAIVGHEFPGGVYAIAHWENVLLSSCTGVEPLPGGIVHPVALFHVPILGARTSIAEMFALGKAASDFSIGIESYDWEMFAPLREDERYAVSGTIVSAERRADPQGAAFDRIQFQFEIAHPDKSLAARTTITWHYRRGRDQ